MNAFQRLLLGIGAGGLLTLFAFPTPRAFLLHPFHRQTIRSALQSHALSSNRTPVEIPLQAQHLSHEERDLLVTSIARQLARHKGIVQEGDYELALRFLSSCWQLDPDNAFWPQLIAATHVRCGHPEKGKTPWITSATLSRWAPGIPRQLEALWEYLAKAESQKMAWQGFATLRFRGDEHIRLIREVPEALLNSLQQINHAEKTKIRVITIANAALIRSGASSLTSASQAIQMALNAIGLQKEDLSPQHAVHVEKRRAEFEKQVSQIFGQEQREKTQRDLETLIASYFHLMNPQQVRETKQKTLFSTLAVTALPSATLLIGIIFGILWGLGILTRANLGTIPHPDTRLVALSGIILAILILLSRAPWMLAIWFAILGILLAIPMEIAKPGPVTWSTRSRIVLNSILAVGSLFALIWFVLDSPAGEYLPIPVASPSTQNLSNSLSDPPLETASFFQTTHEAPRWRYLFIFTLSLSAAFAVAWARVKTQPVFLILGETWAYIGLNGMLLFFTTCVIITPACLFIDRNLQETAHAWIINEPLAFEVG